MRRDAFTLVELLIVVVMLAIIAAIVLPRFSNASQQARASMLADDLRVIRSQLEVFKGHHLGIPPGYPDCDTSQAPTEGAFIDQMTMSSTAAGATAPPGTDGFDFGPYLLEMVPNPFNDKASIDVLADDADFPDAPDDSHGWIYQPATLEFRADSPGTDDAGKSYFEY
ncbi:MAG: type II secretion system protein [Phycisphaerae bacterium]|nr:type II secretion system protein [Phycisphaerae bacterium]